MLGGYEHAAGHGLRLGGDLVEGEDGRARHAGALQALEHLYAREVAGDGGDRLEDVVPMRYARRIVPEARIAGHARNAERLARLGEESVGRGGDHDPGIAG